MEKLNFIGLFGVASGISKGFVKAKSKQLCNAVSPVMSYSITKSNKELKCQPK